MCRSWSVCRCTPRPPSGREFPVEQAALSALQSKTIFQTPSLLRHRIPDHHSSLNDGRGYDAVTNWASEILFSIAARTMRPVQPETHDLRAVVAYIGRQTNSCTCAELTITNDQHRNCEKSAH